MAVGYSIFAPIGAKETVLGGPPVPHLPVPLLDHHWVAWRNWWRRWARSAGWRDSRRRVENSSQVNEALRAEFDRRRHQSALADLVAELEAKYGPLDTPADRAAVDRFRELLR